MSLSSEIIRVLKAEGYRINEAITDALDEFVDLVEEENEEIDEHFEDEDDDAEEPEAEE